MERGGTNRLSLTVMRSEHLHSCLLCRLNHRHDPSLHGLGKIVPCIYDFAEIVGKV
jgi:hypothetical protein